MKEVNDWEVFNKIVEDDDSILLFYFSLFTLF